MSLRNLIRNTSKIYPIKYGLNPHQRAIICNKSNSNIKLLNGFPSYINYRCFV